MKKLISSLLLATGLVLSAQAAHFGASAGYLVDSEEAYYSVRGGTTLKETSAMLHLLEVELGFTEEQESGIDGEIMPLTLNYRAEFLTTGRFTPYAGLGAGVARVELEGFGFDDRDTVFAAQAFAGISFKASNSVSLNLGAKYLWLDDAELFGFNADLGDDVAIEAGLSIKF
ncbi:outer membrane protein [Oleiharenicola lentus]|uniref:outer membrane protein n=1 Tax=Oleiharenicola lentus TaxID=2508720 RepID=UPI003F679930